ncbi:type II toxin-antitoxin system RelE/ParE family toxin [Granulicella mallensis]|jgi:toxin ParE1/3/4|uniref:Toxin ParE1/3/4 n=1 Tax=Granulicella mallensis TaxID=940614 RepID=A0A7W8ECF1_9BACT|nr:type II toxin-antitoxin system RelE/ParE family toxin [Granulicella mallensis]MBB5066827.1 toxin ParE1/3/4 [Granulicella mallensis]
MRVRWSEDASLDRADIVEYIANDNIEAAITVGERIEDQVDELANHPWMGRVGEVQGTRELVIQRTPYIVVYRVEDNVVDVMRVLHGAQQWPA